MWYYITHAFGRDANAVPPVRVKAAHTHLSGHKEPKSGATVYGWIETYEPLDTATIARYGLIEGDDNGQKEKV